jgi:hypothetical protein
MYVYIGGLRVKHSIENNKRGENSGDMCILFAGKTEENSNYYFVGI